MMKNKILSQYKILPLFVVLLLPQFIEAIIKSEGKLFIAFLFSLVFPYVFINLLKIKPFLITLLSFFVLIISLIYSTQVLEYGTYVNESTWYTLGDTDKSETIEFLINLSTSTKLLLTIQIVVFLFYLKYSFERRFVFFKRKYKIILLLLVIVIIADYSFRGASRLIFPLRAYQNLSGYFHSVKLQKEYDAIHDKAKFGAKRIKEFDSGTKETIVIVIGETLRKDHLEYYGYSKPTTPHLKKEDLIVFSNVISPANQTINSLKRVFTKAEYLDEKNYWGKPSLIKAFKEVGFRTFWVTNHRVYGKHSSQASYIAKESDEFITHPESSFDGVVFSDYNNVLGNNKFNKKVVFVHLMGSHATYNKRYPEKYNVFSKKLSDDYRVNTLRDYDNSVRYNDYVLAELLNKLKSIEGEKSFVMFSDHGESLFDSGKDKAGHGYTKPSQSEYIVPLIIWLSDEFKTKHTQLTLQLTKNRDKSIIMSDLFHTLPSFYGIEFDELLQENNFFGDNYKPKFNRKVLNTNLELLEFDKLKKTKAKIDY